MKWLDKPEDHDWAAAGDYLTLLYPPGRVSTALVNMIHREPMTTRKAKDILRASGLELLPEGNQHVRKDLDKIRDDKHLSPILLVRDNGRLLIADGYHRVCACYHVEENTDIPCVIGDM